MQNFESINGEFLIRVCKHTIIIKWSPELSPNVCLFFLCQSDITFALRPTLQNALPYSLQHTIHTFNTHTHRMIVIHFFIIFHIETKAWYGMLWLEPLATQFFTLNSINECIFEKHIEKQQHSERRGDHHSFFRIIQLIHRPCESNILPVFSVHLQ